jgi:hypothetical protein
MNRIDKLFRDRLEHTHMEVPEHNWDIIMSRLEKKEKTHPPFWTTHFATVLTSMVLGFWMICSMQSYPVAAIQPENSPITELPKPDELAIATVTSHTPLDAIITTTSNSENLANPTSSFNQNSANNTSVPTTSIDQTIVDHVVNNEGYSSYSLEAQMPISHLDPMQIMDGNIKAEVITDESIIKTKSYVDALPLLASSESKKLKSFRKFKLKTSQTNIKPGSGCPFGAEINDKSLEIYYSNDFPTVVENRKNPLATPYYQMRDEAETPMYSYSFGARFGYRVGYRWNVYTGVNFSQFNQKFAYTDPESAKEIITITKDYVYENGRIVDSVITEKKEIIPGTLKIQHVNRYRSIDIPILARFTILANSALSLSATAGPYFNLTHNAAGITIDEVKLQPRDFNPSDKLYRTQLGLSGYAAVSAAIHILPQIDLVVEPHIRVGFDNINTSRNPLDQKLQTYGVMTGLRYKF